MCDTDGMERPNTYRPYFSSHLCGGKKERNMMDDINKEWKIVDDKNKIGVVGGQVFRRN